jgi:peptidyl-tRNA hydrolase
MASDTENKGTLIKAGSPTLYILMRDDLESLNPGKAMAQASHAYGALLHAVRKHLPMQAMFTAWAEQSEQEFGTTIVLAASKMQIDRLLHEPVSYKCIAGWVHDPTYPIKDGNYVHHIPLNTCAFIFGSKDDIVPDLAHLSLYP